MNHQVKNNIDIQAPWREGSQTMNLEKLGPRRQVTCERDDGIEPLDVTHLKYALVPGCGLDQRSGFFGRGSNGLLNQNIQAVFEQIDTNPCMIAGWDCQANCIDFAENIAVIGEGGGLVQRRDPLGSGLENIDDSCQFHTLKLGIQACMLFPEMSDPNDSYSDHKNFASFA